MVLARATRRRGSTMGMKVKEGRSSVDIQEDRLVNCGKLARK